MIQNFAKDVIPNWHKNVIRNVVKLVSRNRFQLYILVETHCAGKRQSPLSTGQVWPSPDHLVINMECLKVLEKNLYWECCIEEEVGV